MKKILVTTSSFDADGNPALQEMRSMGMEIVFNPFRRRLTEPEVGALLAEGDTVGMIAGVEPLTAAAMARAPSLRVISRCGIGLESVDLEAAKVRGISVFNTPQAPVDAVAELTLGLMLSLLRRVSQADRVIREGRWQQMMGNLLAFQTVGIVGFGRIGRRVAELVQAFGARVVANDLAAVPTTGNACLCSLEELLSRADIVTLHMPYSEASKHLIGEAQLAKMKRGALIVNTARGGLIDEVALESALANGHLAGAALDTFEIEPYKGPLIGRPEAILTAHMGSYAKESRIQMEREAAENALRGLVECGAVSH